MATSPDAVPGDDRRSVAPGQIAMIVGGLLLLLLLVWFFLLAGDDEVETPAAPAPVTDEAPEEEVTEDEAPDSGGDGPVETFEVFAPKDPFDPLVSASAGDGGAADGGTTTGDGTTAGDGTTTNGDGTTTTTTDDGTGTTTTTTSGGGNGGGRDVQGHRVQVIDVYQQEGAGRAQVQVDGTVYTVDEGERFAGNFQLMSASGRCASMLYGDDQFTLCEGEEILK